MKTIGIFTRNFSIFYDIIRLLKEKEVEFFSLSSGRVPPWIKVVLATEDSKDEIKFKNVVIVNEHNTAVAVEEAILLLNRNSHYNLLIIGIDPGEKPGVAIYGDGQLLTTAKVEFPEDTAAIVKRVVDFYSTDKVIVRIGNGAPTFRNRIINTILPLNVEIEMVDERRTTIKNRSPDIQAAIKIGLKKGKQIREEMEVTPTNGELNNIKRRSRLLSNGRFTISRRQAEAVATGEITLNEAVEKTRKHIFGNNDNGRG